MLSNAWDVLGYHQGTTPVHTPELHLIAKSILTVSSRSTTQQEQQRAANSSSCLIGLIFISKSQYWSATRSKQMLAKMPHSCRAHGAVPWQCTEVTECFWAPQSMQRKKSLRTEQPKGEVASSSREMSLTAEIAGMHGNISHSRTLLSVTSTFLVFL